MPSPDELVAAAVQVLTAGAVVVAALVWVRTRSWSPAVPVLLELLLAAGLLRLSADGDWRAVATAAVVVVIRTVVRRSLAGSRPGRRRAVEEEMA